MDGTPLVVVHQAEGSVGGGPQQRLAGAIGAAGHGTGNGQAHCGANGRAHNGCCIAAVTEKATDLLKKVPPCTSTYVKR